MRSLKQEQNQVEIPMNLKATFLDAAYCQVKLEKDINFLQIMVRFTGKNGPNNGAIVFEKCLTDTSSRWKIVGRVDESNEYFDMTQ